MSLVPGQMLSHYRLVEKIGEGGMGIVWKAMDTALDRDVAIKVLSDRLAREPNALRRFEQEAKAVAALSHPNILSIHQLGRDAGIYYVVTELLHGETLRERLARGPLPFDEAIGLLLQVSRGLAAAHSKGVIHRDLKPANVFLIRDGQAKILDFGLAKRVFPRGGGDLATITLPPESGMIVGTLGYMSPEQLRGDNVDPRSDIFALGAISYEMITGRQPFLRASAAETISAILREDPAPPSRWVPEVPAELEDLVTSCMAKNPADRPESAGDLLAILRNLSRQTQGVDVPTVPGRLVTQRGPSIAVLPFVDMSPDRDQAYFCEGMAEEILDALTRIEGLRVAARTSTFECLKMAPDIRSIGDGLNVGNILEGSVRTAGTMLRVTARLVNVANGFDVWSARYDRAMRDVFAIQAEIASSVAGALKKQLVGPPPNARRQPTARDLEAYHLYLKGRHYRYTKNDYEAALPYFEQAVARDPSHVQARARLAEVFILRALYGTERPREAYRRARAQLDAALAIEPDTSEALAVDALLRLHQDRDWVRAEEELRRAIDLNPENVHARAWFGILLSALNRQEEALESVRTAQEIDPLSPYANAMTGLVLLSSGSAEQAIEEYEKANEVDPDNVLALWGLGVALVTQGRKEAGIRKLKQAVDRTKGASFYLSLWGWSLAVAGNEAEAREVLNDLDIAPGQAHAITFGTIWLLAALGESERAWELLEHAEQQGHPLAVDLNLPGYDPLRSDQRFAGLRRRMNLPAV